MHDQTRNDMSVEIKELHFSYGQIKALDGVDLSLPQGAIGLLGPNGAGKSTLLRILLGFLSLREGRAESSDMILKRSRG
jgi:ABC-2 type transport system ATP-binding protein